jgi:hypothetical protein
MGIAAKPLLTATTRCTSGSLQTESLPDADRSCLVAKWRSERVELERSEVTTASGAIRRFTPHNSISPCATAK